MAGFRVIFAVAVVSLCALFYACVVAHLQVPIHYANFQLEVDPRPVPVPAGAEEGQPQEQRRVTEVHFQTDEDNDIFGAACNLWQKLQVFSPCTKAFPGDRSR